MTDNTPDNGPVGTPDEPEEEPETLTTGETTQPQDTSTSHTESKQTKPPKPPGWYPDPWRPSHLPHTTRYWDGTAWTSHILTPGTPQAQGKVPLSPPMVPLPPRNTPGLGKKIGQLIAQTATIFFTVSLCLFSFFLAFPFLIQLLFTAVDIDEDSTEVIYGSPKASSSFLSIPITGTILGNETLDGNVFGGTTYGYEIKEQLKEAADLDEYDGIIIEINSGGGTVVGARAIADGVTEFRQRTKKPVVAFISGIGASGAYLVASRADLIIMDHGSLVGSIGVTLGPFAFYDGVTEIDGGLLSKGIVTQNGIEQTYITAGRGKDMGNPWRRLTEEELSVLQQGVNNEYNEFVAQVSMYREDLTPEKIRDQIGALLYDNKTAISLHLADETQSREEAYHRLASLVGETNFKIVQKPSSGSGLWGIFGNASVPSSATACPLANVYLAFYGDPTQFCS